MNSIKLKPIRVLRTSASELPEGATPYRIDLAAMHTKHDLLQAVARGLSFPDYFRPNWDAFEECLRDLESGDRVLVFEHAENLLQLSPDDLATLTSILAGVSGFWAEQGRSFASLLITSSASAADQLSALL